MSDDRFGDPINSDPWPMPVSRPPRSLLDRLRDWWQRVWVGLVGWNTDDA